MQKRINIQNKKARFEYEILDQFTAGIVLTGTEIKSIRDSKASIAESFCEFNENGELFAVNMYIEEYAFGTRFNHRPRGSRKLLLQKKELNKLLKHGLENKILSDHILKTKRNIIIQIVICGRTNDQRH